jgi:drug/metabolite transporter (DMT)-like permease
MATDTQQPAAATGLGTAAVVAAVVCWGLGNVLVKYIRLPGLALAFDRMALGAVVWSLVLFAAGRRLSWRALRIAAPGGVAFGVDVALFFSSLKHTSVADASVITALQPALVFLVAGRLFGERLSRRIVAWTGVAVCGVVVAVVASASTAGRTLGGDVLAAISLLAWAWYFVASKQARQQLTALEYQACMTIVAACVIAPVALLRPHDLVVPDAATAGWVLVMVCVPGGGHLLVNWAHRYATITLASTLTLGIPVIGALGAAALLGETLTGLQLAGIAVALVALALLVRRPPPAVAPVVPVVLAEPPT